MKGFRIPKWTGHVAFALVVLLVAAVVVVVASRDDASEAPAAKAPAESLPPRDEPRGVAVRAMRYVSIGTLESAAAFYHPRIVSEFGRTTVLRALALRKPGLAGQSFEPSFTEPTTGGTLSVVRASGPQGNGEYFFILRREGGRWLIVHDSLLGDGLTEIAQLREQARVGTSGKKAERSAAKAAERMSLEYRRLLVGS